MMHQANNVSLLSTVAPSSPRIQLERAFWRSLRRRNHTWKDLPQGRERQERRTDMKWLAWQEGYSAQTYRELANECSWYGGLTRPSRILDNRMVQLRSPGKSITGAELLS